MAIDSDTALMFVAIATAYVSHWASLWAQRNGCKFATVAWYAIGWICILVSISAFARIFTMLAATL